MAIQTLSSSFLALDFWVLISAFLFSAQPHSSKQLKDDDEEANAEDRDYEEWKKRILESAAKAMASTGRKDNEKSNS